mmetsp:Transcript_21362/g.32065  ORF Transcript_21362/g.32065 Transcript_21362/m.32065 type:complete len:276 (-) Transcript_21362:753-1580(-)
MPSGTVEHDALVLLFNFATFGVLLDSDDDDELDRFLVGGIVEKDVHSFFLDCNVTCKLVGVFCLLIEVVEAVVVVLFVAFEFTSDKDKGSTFLNACSCLSEALISISLRDVASSEIMVSFSFFIFDAVSSATDLLLLCSSTVTFPLCISCFTWTAEGVALALVFIPAVDIAASEMDFASVLGFDIVFKAMDLLGFCPLGVFPVFGSCFTIASEGVALVFAPFGSIETFCFVVIGNPSTAVFGLDLTLFVIIVDFPSPLLDGSFFVLLSTDEDGSG